MSWRMLGASARNNTSGRMPSMLITSTWRSCDGPVAGCDGCVDWDRAVAHIAPKSKIRIALRNNMMVL